MSAPSPPTISAAPRHPPGLFLGLFLLPVVCLCNSFFLLLFWGFRLNSPQPWAEILASLPMDFCLALLPGFILGNVCDQILWFIKRQNLARARRFCFFCGTAGALISLFFVMGTRLDSSTLIPAFHEIYWRVLGLTCFVWSLALWLWGMALRVKS